MFETVVCSMYFLSWIIWGIHIEKNPWSVLSNKNVFADDGSYSQVLFTGINYSWPLWNTWTTTKAYLLGQKPFNAFLCKKTFSESPKLCFSVSNSLRFYSKTIMQKLASHTGLERSENVFLGTRSHSRNLETNVAIFAKVRSCTDSFT